MITAPKSAVPPGTARKIVHKVIGVAVRVVAAGATHEGTQQWIHHLISTTNLHT